LVLLESPALEPSWPVVRAIADSRALVGAEVELTGFGIPELNGTTGVKRTGTATVDQLDAFTLQTIPTPSNGCGGDSGGPLFYGGIGSRALLGIVRAGDQACVSFTRATRVDAYFESFVRPYLALTAPGTRAVGERCFEAASCISGSC